MFDTETVLILIALASAVVGTLWKARPWGKTLIIALATATAATAIVESQRKASDKARAEAEAAAARRNVELILRAVQPPAIFDEAVLAAFREVAGDQGLFVSGQTVREDGSRLFEFRDGESESEDLAGIVYLDVPTRQKMFVAFAKESDLTALAREVVSGPWGDDDLAADWNVFARATFEIAKGALSDHVPEGTVYTGRFDPDARTVAVDVNLPNGRYVGSIDFDADFMAALPDATPLRRGVLIHEHTLSQIVR